MPRKFKGLFVNNVKAQDSIYESGVMVFNCLKLSDKINLDYVEIDIEQRSISLGYDFYFFNFHPSTMSWVDTKSLRKLNGTIMTMVLEVLPGDPFVMCPPRDFDAYCVLDPSLKSDNSKVFAFPRPLEWLDVKAYEQGDIPVIGSFGFATKGKGFHHVVESVNKEFDRAIVKINIPFGSFVPESESYAKFLAKLCKEKAKEGVEVQVTHNYMTKPELIEWCAKNTLNCFLYDRNMPGLAATTDQAIVSGRPLAISRNDTFRHILSYLEPYPQMSLKKSINESLSRVIQMREAWTAKNFALKFEEVIDHCRIVLSQNLPIVEFFEIPIKKKGFLQIIDVKFNKYKRLLTARYIKRFLLLKLAGKHEELI